MSLAAFESVMPGVGSELRTACRPAFELSCARARYMIILRT